MGTTADVNSMDDYVPNFASYYLHSGEHLRNMWLILMGYTALYAAIATISLEFVDRDRR